MSIFKCKMCGGTIEFEKGATVGVCDSCGMKQTLPRLDDEKKINLYDRANHFRRNNDYDKAMAIYEQILNEDGTDAEAYWSLVLCRYGIEYVEDPATHKRVPTVNRAQFTSIFADMDYKSALQYADGYQKTIYEEEAKAIDDIQKGILEISSKEEPFDVFICYKETDNYGRRTQDSVLANDLYHQLTQEGFNVFFSRITLEDKLGTAYEPYIFAALNSAKVMVVLGTKPEYFNAVWVKNEWSRYLALVKNSGGKKMLIPAYRDMDPYDLPEEFSLLQAQDMSKLGFMQDLIRGIKKIITAGAPKQVEKETVVVQTRNTNITPLLERMFLFLEDGKWQDANIYCEKILDIDPKNAEAYLGKLMAELHVNSRNQLADCTHPFDDRENFSKVLRFGDEKLESEMRGYIAHINERNETARLEGIYNRAFATMNTAYSEATYNTASEMFKTIPGFKDADVLAEKCQNQAEECRIAAAKKRKKVMTITASIVCVCITFVIVLTTMIIPNGKYNAAIALIDKGDIINAYENLVDMNGYKDSADKANEIFGKYISEKIRISGVGGVVCFGSYEQDNDQSNGKEDIEWLVLAKEGDQALIISKYALDCNVYNTSFPAVTWENCTLRKWLNDTFLQNAFSMEEQEIIATTNVSADKNPEYSTNPGNATNDKVFLLSIPEVNKYFSSDEVRKCAPTDYAIAEGAFTSDYFTTGGKATCYWWLRSPGQELTTTSVVLADGSIRYDGYGYIIDGAVRPALWINLDS